MNKEWDEFTKDLQRDANGSLIALSRWGWKIEVVDGKKYLLAATEGEVQTARALQKGRPLTSQELAAAPQGCYGGNGTPCYAPPGCNRCTLIIDPGSGQSWCECTA